LGTKDGQTESIRKYDWVYLVTPDSETISLKYGHRYSVIEIEGDFARLINDWGRESLVHMAELTKTDPKLEEYIKAIKQEQGEIFKQEPEDDALDSQIGGRHYIHLAIQPIEYIEKNGLGFSEGNVIKYVTRWQHKGGVQDLEKAKHCLELLISLVKQGDRAGLSNPLIRQDFSEIS
jgi:hypothetical protein